MPSILPTKRSLSPDIANLVRQYPKVFAEVWLKMTLDNTQDVDYNDLHRELKKAKNRKSRFLYCNIQLQEPERVQQVVGGDGELTLILGPLDSN